MPSSHWEDLTKNDDGEYEVKSSVGKELKDRILNNPLRWKQKVQVAKKDQENRMTKQNSRDRLPKWKKNQTLKKWWEGKYGEQNYFSIQDAIKENFVKSNMSIYLECPLSFRRRPPTLTFLIGRFV